MQPFLLGILLFISIRSEAQSIPSPVQPRSSPSANPITYKIIKVANGRFGYDIFNGDHRLIHQTSMPGLPGNQGFRRKSDARKVAALVADKLHRHIVPPTVTVHEMDSLKINYKSSKTSFYEKIFTKPDPLQHFLVRDGSARLLATKKFPGLEWHSCADRPIRRGGL